MSLLSKLFGGGDGAPGEPEPEIYKDYRITPAPMKEGGRYRLAARIEKTFGDTVKTHHLIRADTLDSAEAAAASALDKARRVIDEQGDAIFR